LTCVFWAKFEENFIDRHLCFRSNSQNNSCSLRDDKQKDRQKQKKHGQRKAPMARTGGGREADLSAALLTKSVISFGRNDVLLSSSRALLFDFGGSLIFGWASTARFAGLLRK
jgi:hypothetical protein